MGSHQIAGIMGRSSISHWFFCTLIFIALSAATVASEKNDTQLVISRNKRSPIFPKINLDNVIGTIFGVKGWPAMLTNQVGWVSFRIFGHIVGGTAYNFILNTFDMSEGTRKTFQELDVLYGPTNCVKNIFGTIKAIFFNFGGRTLVNILTDPDGSAETFKTTTVDKVKTRILSEKYQNIWFVRFWYETIWILLGAWVLYYIADDDNRNAAARVKREFSLQPNNFENHMKNLNSRLESFESSCLQN